MGGRDFGSLVHRMLEWVPLTDDGPARLAAMAAALAPSFGLEADAADRAAAAAARVLALPAHGAGAPRAADSGASCPCGSREGSELVEGLVDLVFEEDGALVIVDYKTDHIGGGPGPGPGRPPRARSSSCTAAAWPRPPASPCASGWWCSPHWARPSRSEAGPFRPARTDQSGWKVAVSPAYQNWNAVAGAEVAFR